MRRNTPGLASLDRYTSTHQSLYNSLSDSITNQQVSNLQSNLQHFQSSLRHFASKHRSRIVTDPVFRAQFSDMCAELGVDPLGGGKKGWWDWVGVGEWTYELAVQVVDVCLATRDRNGGLIEMEELLKGVTRLRTGSTTTAATSSPSTSFTPSVTNPATATSSTIPPSSSSSTNPGAVTASDISRAIKALEPLGCGYTILTIANQKMVRSVPAAFDTDSLIVLECASENGKGFVTEGMIWEWTRKRSSSYSGGPSSSTTSEVASRSGGKPWPIQRISDALQKALMDEGLVWVDEQDPGGKTQYWVPALFEFGGD